MSGTDCDTADAYVADTFGVDPSTYVAPGGGAPGAGEPDAGASAAPDDAGEAAATGGDTAATAPSADGPSDGIEASADSGGSDAGAGDPVPNGPDSAGGDASASPHADSDNTSESATNDTSGDSGNDHAGGGDDASAGSDGPAPQDSGDDGTGGGESDETSGAPDAGGNDAPDDTGGDTSSDTADAGADASADASDESRAPADPDAGEAAADGDPDAGEAADTSPGAPDSVPAVPEHKILGGAQSARAAALLDKLSPDDKTKYQSLLDGAKSDPEKQYLTKALAAGHSVADIEAFEKKIAGKDAKWMQDNLSLTGSSDGTGVQQQWSHSCNATTVEAVKGEMDPIYALSMHDANPNMDEVDDKKPTLDNPNLAADQKAMLESSYQGGVTAAVGYAGKAAPRATPAAGGGRWADDLLNKNSDTTGVSYQTKQIGQGASVDDAMTSIDANVAQGIPVPLVIGNGTGQYTHYVLVTATDPGPPKTYSIHDPYSGETKIRNETQMKQGKLDIANSNQITAFENPTPVPVK